MLSGAPTLEPDRMAKLTTEMTRAIKRQEPNSGLEYWRATGINNVGLTTTEKRPTYKKVTQINLNFPGVFIPNLNNVQQQKPKTREHPTSAVVLARSRTSLVPRVTSSSRSQRNANNNVIPESKKVMVTDLTCLQLADTLLSSKKSPYAGLLNFWPGRSRYTDYFPDGRDDNHNEETGFGILSDISTPVQKHTSSAMSRSGTSIPVLHYKTLPAEEEVLHNNNYREPYNHITVLDSPKSSCAESSSSQIEKRDLKPQKSILKNGSQRQCSANSNGRTISPPEQSDRNSASKCLYQLPNANHNEKQRNGFSGKIVTLDKITPSLQQQSGSRPNSYKSDSHSSTNTDYALQGIMNDLSTRKRSVRFNSTHEIREFAPCEPISYC